MPTLPEMIHRGAIEDITARGVFIPPIFVLHIHIPTPNVMHLKRDGPGTAFVIYFTLSKVPPALPLHYLTSKVLSAECFEGVG